jgi:hypothetical protein
MITTAVSALDTNHLAHISSDLVLNFITSP